MMAHLLVVDDDPGIRDSLSRELRAAGYDVSTASDGAEAVRLEAQGPFDLILTDLAMPVADGFHLSAQLWEDLSTMDLPINWNYNSPPPSSPNEQHQYATGTALCMIHRG